MQTELQTAELNLPGLPDGPSWNELNPKEEATLTEQIDALWSAQQQGRLTARHTKAQLRDLRAQLSEMLHGMKAILVQTGRGGGWAAYLRRHKLPRATADRYVLLHHTLLHPTIDNRSTEAISEPTETEVRRFAQSLLPRLSRTLTTPLAFFFFVDELVQHLPGANGRETDDGVAVVRPIPSTHRA